MIQINLVARIDDDKNSFLSLVYLAYQLKQGGVQDFNILFIGAINKLTIYQNIVQMANLLGVEEHISFTKKSIPMAELSDEIKDGYFFNYSVGSFLGYSAIDSINMGLKAIFCNCDNEIEHEVSNYINVCPDLNSVITLIKLIDKDAASINRQILANNNQMKKEYRLNENERSSLLSLLLPANN